MPKLGGALSALLLILPAAAKGETSLSDARRWICYYGPRVSLEAWSSLDMAVVDPDAFALPLSSGPTVLAYVSVGEADARRGFWREVEGKDYLVEANPEWEGAHRVDLRAAAWRTLLLDSVIPDARAKGYGGVMLDTIDVAGYLESSAPARFAGSVDAAVSLVLEMRRRYPDLAIVMNNGLDLLGRVGGAIDGVLVEDLYTRCVPGETKCSTTPEPIRDAKEAALDAFRRETGKPVFVLLYAGLEERKTRRLRRAVKRAQRKGYRAYVTTPALDRLGEIDP